MSDSIGTATYSPEDNKLRIYPLRRLDAETYARVKASGFKWAPKQELFVAPAWSCSREDLARELCGDIEPEEMTLAERAELKAERLEGYAAKRLSERNAYQRAADQYAERFAFGQPILVGHHSERSARVAQKRMHSAIDQAAKRERVADGHLYRARGALAHANSKNSDRVRLGRIESLLADYRALCRTESEYRDALAAWELCSTEGRVKLLADAGRFMSYDDAAAIRKDPSGWEVLRARKLAAYAKALEPGARVHRRKAHTLNRLGYERDLLGPVARYAGDIIPGVVQVFARTWGVEKPKAEHDGDAIRLTAESPLPLFVSENPDAASLTPDAWRDLFQSLGYTPPAKIHAKASTAPPLLNVDAETLSYRCGYNRGETRALEVVRVTKAQYAKVSADYKGTRSSPCGGFRFRVAMRSSLFGYGAGPGSVAVFLTDSKAHPLPEPQEAAA